MAYPIIPLAGTNPKLFSSFMGRVRVTDGCWEWTGWKSRYGYGRVTINRRTVHAHRLAYEIFVGAVPASLCVCHRCDNRKCVNAVGGHLFLGTKAENNRDMDRKGRRGTASGVLNGSHTHPERLQRGEQRPNAKITESDVREIRSLVASGMLQQDAATKFGICQSIVSGIVLRKRWAHVSDAVEAA